MRIALVSDVYLPRLGGIEMHVHDLGLELVRAGHSVTVFTVADSPSPVSDLPVVRLPAVAGLPTGTDTLRQSLLAGHFDLVHAHSSLFSPLAWSATRIASEYGIPAVITMHSLPAEGGVLVPWLLARLDRGFGQRVRWTAVSEVVAGALRRALPGRRVELLHNGIDPQPWRQPRRPDHVLTVVSTMRLTRRKRPSALLRILADLRNQLPPDLQLRAVVIGSGPQDATMARAVRRHGMDWVEFTGRLTRYEIQQLYSAADVYLAPAELESFGVAALEARCAGLGVVAMASGGVGEFVRPGIEGYLVETDAEMAAVTARLLTSPELLRGMQDHNRATEPTMTWQLVIEQHLGVYQQALTQSALSNNYIASVLMDVPTIMELDR